VVIADLDTEILDLQNHGRVASEADTSPPRQARDQVAHLGLAGVAELELVPRTAVSGYR
jgi:hypothetical protein